MGRILWLLCLLIGHHWQTVLINGPKFVRLMHLHSQAGCWSICRRCGKEWNDLFYYGPAKGLDRIVVAPQGLEYMCEEGCWCRRG